MLDIKLVRANPDLVKENIKEIPGREAPLVDEVLEFDAKLREAKTRADSCGASGTPSAKRSAAIWAKGMKAEAEEAKAKVSAMAKGDGRAGGYGRRPLRQDPGADAGDPQHHRPLGSPSARMTAKMWRLKSSASRWSRIFEVPYHIDIMERLNGIDLDSARRTSGNGFYYLKGHCPAPFWPSSLRPGFHDRPGLHLYVPPS